MSIELLLTKYWSQTTLILFGIGFLIKSFIDLKSKKTEINHSLFQQKKLEAANLFFSNYASARQMWIDIPIYDILELKMNTKEIDSYIFPKLNELRRNVIELKIYFDKKDHIYFQNILDNMHLINSKLSDELFNRTNNSCVLHKSNSFQFFRENKLAENELLFEKISLMLQDTFN